MSHGGGFQSGAGTGRVGSMGTRTGPIFQAPSNQVISTAGSGEKKSRKHKACMACKAGHLKCDHGMPSCGRCVAKRIQCVYSEVTPSPSTSLRPIVFVDHAFNDRSSSSTTTTVHSDDYSSSDPGSFSTPSHLPPPIRSPSSGDYTLAHTFSGTSPLSATGFQNISLNPNEMQGSMTADSLASYFYPQPAHPYAYQDSMDYAPSSNYPSYPNRNVSLPNQPINAFSAQRANFGAGATNANQASLPHAHHPQTHLAAHHSHQPLSSSSSSSSSHPSLPHASSSYWPNNNDTQPQWTSYSSHTSGFHPSSSSSDAHPDGFFLPSSHGFAPSHFTGAGPYTTQGAAGTTTKSFNHKRSAANHSGTSSGLPHLSSLAGLSANNKLSAASTSSPPLSPKHRHRRTRAPSQSTQRSASGGSSAPSSATSSAGSLLTNSTITPTYSQPSSPHTPMNHLLQSPADDYHHLGSSYSYSYGENGSFLSGSSTHNSSPHSFGFIGGPLQQSEWEYGVDVPVISHPGNGPNPSNSGNMHYASSRMLHPSQQHQQHQQQHPSYPPSQHQQPMQGYHGSVESAGVAGGGRPQFFQRLPVSSIQGRDSPMGDGTTGTSGNSGNVISSASFNPSGGGISGGSTTTTTTTSSTSVTGGGINQSTTSSSSSSQQQRSSPSRMLGSSGATHTAATSTISSSNSSSMILSDTLSPVSEGMDSTSHSHSNQMDVTSSSTNASSLPHNSHHGEAFESDGIIAASGAGVMHSNSANVSPSPASRRTFGGSNSSPSNLIIKSSGIVSGMQAGKRGGAGSGNNSGTSSGLPSPSPLVPSSSSSSTTTSPSASAISSLSMAIGSGDGARGMTMPLASPSPSPMGNSGMAGIQSSSAPNLNLNPNVATTTGSRSYSPVPPGQSQSSTANASASVSSSSSSSSSSNNRPAPFLRSKLGSSGSVVTKGSNSSMASSSSTTAASSSSSPSSSMTSPRHLSAASETEITNELLQLQDAFVSIFEPRAPINLEITWSPADSRPYWSLFMAKEGRDREETVQTVLNEVKSKWESGVASECASGVKQFLRLYEQCVVLMCGASSLNWMPTENTLAAHCEKMTIFLSSEVINFDSEDLQEKECERFVDALSLYSTYLRDKQMLSASQNALLMAYTALTSHLHLVSPDAVDRLYVWTLFIISSPQERNQWIGMLTQAGLNPGHSPMALTVTQQSNLVSLFTSGPILDENALQIIWTQLDELEQLIQKIPRLPRTRPFRYMRIAAVYLLRIEIYNRLDRYTETLHWIRFLQDIAAMSPGLKISLCQTIKAVSDDPSTPNGEHHGLTCANTVLGQLDQ